MYIKELSIPENVTVEVSGNKVKVSGEKGQLERKFELVKGVKMEKTDNKIKVSAETERRKVKALVGTIIAHIKNMIEGVTQGFTYKLKVVFSHFPVTVKVEGKQVIIQNFLGSRTPRVAKIVGNTEVKIEGQDITLSGIDLENVGQTAANIELATRITGYDRRRFMDGCYIVSQK
jgi:large subunit ribosomal protein L6